MSNLYDVGIIFGTVFGHDSQTPGAYKAPTTPSLRHHRTYTVGLGRHENKATQQLNDKDQLLNVIRTHE